jgi:hypothetical protein
LNHDADWDERRSGYHIADEFPLTAGIAVDVALGRFDRAMTGAQLHVAQAAAGTMDVAGSDRDEAAATGM